MVPGQRFHAKVRFESKARTPYDELVIMLASNVMRLDANGRVAQTAQLVHGTRRLRAAVLEAGSEEVDVQFDLPSNLPPSYRSRLSHIEHMLRVCVRIPWWLDRDVSYPVEVMPLPTAPVAPQPVVYTTQGSDRSDDQPILELSLDDDAVQSGGELRGAVALSGLGRRSVRRLELELHTLESPLLRGEAAQTGEQRTWRIHEGSVAEGETVPFRVRVPSLPPALDTGSFRAHHQLRAVAVVTFGEDLVVHAPLRWCNAPTSTPRANKVPAVGRQRRVDVWRSAMASLEQTGVTALQFDSETERATFAVGRTEIAVDAEHDFPPTMCARYTFPSCGLGVHLTERAPRNPLIAKLLPQAQGRFEVSARDAKQADAWLHGTLLSALQKFDAVELRDDAIDVTRNGGVYQLRGLLSLLEDVVALGIALNAASVPPPPALASALDVYRIFANAVGCTLRVGDLSLRHWTVRGAVLDLEHRFEGERPVESLLWMHVEPGNGAASMLQVLREETQLPVLEEAARIGVVLPLVHDPALALDAADRLADIAARALGGAAGPYR